MFTRRVIIGGLIAIFFSVIFLILTYVFTNEASSASYTWDGGGATNNWSDCTNWSTNVCPTSTDSVTFDGTSTKNATVDAGYSGTIAAMTISAGYTGTIDLQRSFTINSTYIQSDGTFNAGSQTLDINSSTFTLSGGTFTASSGTTTVAGAFTISGSAVFNHNSGTFTIDGSSGGTFACNNVTFNLVTFNNTSAKTINSDCSFPLGSNPTLSGGSPITLNGTFSGSGTLTKATAGLLTFNAGATLTGFNGLNVVTLTVAGGTMDFSAYSTFIASGAVTLNSGSLALPSGADLDDLTITGGTFTSPSGNMFIADEFSISGSPTFNHNNGTITFDSTNAATLDCNSISVTFNNIVFAHTTNIKTISEGCNFPLGSNPVITGPLTLNTAMLSGSGTLIMSPTTSTFRFNSGAALSGFTDLDINNTLTISGATLNLSSYNSVDLSGSTSFSLTSGTFTSPSGTMTASGAFTMSGGTFNQGTGGTIVVNGTFSPAGATFNGSNGTLDLNGATSFSFSSGTFNAPSGLMTVSGNFTHSGGTFTHNFGTVRLDGTNQTLTGTTSFYNFSKTVTSAASLTFPASTTTTVTGDLTLTGTSGNLLSLRSSSSPTQWNIDPQSNRNVSYVDVMDSNNLNSSPIIAFNSVNSGNNINWFFSDGTTGPVTSTPVPGSTTLPPSCGDTAPSTAPTLYGAITQSGSSVLLYFTGAGDPVDHYVLQYGTSPGVYQYGSDNIGDRNTRTYLVSSLEPNTTYYFRIRAGNGCAVGAWSNEMSARTFFPGTFSPPPTSQEIIVTPTFSETPLPTIIPETSSEELVPPLVPLLPLPISFSETPVLSQLDATSNQTAMSLGLVLGAATLVASPTILMLLNNLYEIFLRLLFGLLHLLGFRKDRRSWGVVYDAVTKEPLPLAIVRLYSDSGELLETDVTSNEGIFTFLPQIGNYQLTVSKNGYDFPSRLVFGSTDGEYHSIYHGGKFEVKDLDAQFHLGVPIDSVGARVSTFFYFKQFINKVRVVVGWLLLALGFSFALSALLNEVNPLNFLIILFYFLLILLHVRTTRSRYGVVIDSTTNRPLPGVGLALYDIEYNRLVQTRVSNDQGKFLFIVPEGNYRLELTNHDLMVDATRNERGTYQGEIISTDKTKALKLRVVVGKR